jgi:hypothetical protein
LTDVPIALKFFRRKFQSLDFKFLSLLRCRCYYLFISTPQRSTAEFLKQKNGLFHDGVTFFFKHQSTSLSALFVNTSYPDASTTTHDGCFRKLIFIVQELFLKIQLLTIFTTFCIIYYDTLGLMRPFMIGINLVGKDSLNSPHFNIIEDAKDQRCL